MDWVKIFASHIYERGIVSRIQKIYILKHDNKKPNNSIQKWIRDMNIYFSKYIYKWHMKRCSTSLFLREMQSKTTVYHCIIIKMARIKKIIRVGENVKSLDHSHTDSGHAKMVQPHWKTIQQLLLMLSIELSYAPVISLLVHTQEKWKHMGIQKFAHKCLGQNYFYQPKDENSPNIHQFMKG